MIRSDPRGGLVEGLTRLDSRRLGVVVAYHRRTITVGDWIPGGGDINVIIQAVAGPGDEKHNTVRHGTATIVDVEMMDDINRLVLTFHRPAAEAIPMIRIGDVLWGYGTCPTSGRQ